MKFKGYFNYQGQVLILYTYAVGRERAVMNFIHQLSRQLDKTPYHISNFFNGEKDNFQILEEPDDE